MDNYKEIPFIFSRKYRLWRHISFWLIHTAIFILIWNLPDTAPVTKKGSLWLNIYTVVWIPVNILYCYPFVYWALPQFLLKGRFVIFGLLIILWALGGWYINYYFRLYIFIPLKTAIGSTGNRNAGQQGTFLWLNATLGFLSMTVLFKYWAKKQRDWIQAEKGKVTAELQLLKAQVHPHFLFNTLNNIYSFSLENSPKTPQLILKLSSLLSYILYDCRTDEVLLEKEISVMKDYLDLEKERYGNKLEISINIEGDITDKFIAPLLLLPFLENAFKHGTSEQLDRPWLSMDISVKQNTLKCKIVNSKNEDVIERENGIGIMNVKKRLAFLYPGTHELKIDNEPDFFVVSLVLQLKGSGNRNIKQV